MNRHPSLFVVGWGRMGSAVGLQARAAGWQLAGAWSRHAASVRRARRAGVAAALAPSPAAFETAGAGRRGGRPPQPLADLALLAVPDAAIAEVAERLARLPPSRLPRVAAHLSGSLGLEPLGPLEAAGVAVGSLHPLASVVGPETALAGAACAVEGPPAARRLLRALAADLGLRPLRRGPRDRSRYHLAAALLANFSATLAGEAERQLLAAGLTKAESGPALAALLRSVAGNLAARGVQGALTGPIARGDPSVVRRHLALLEGDRDALALYRTLGRLTLDLAAQGPGGDPAGRATIRRLLRS